jgi:hypothetical protein
MPSDNIKHGTEDKEEKDYSQNPDAPNSPGNPPDNALVKERQPSVAGDLSSIHDTHEVGTSGGDQRANDQDPSQGAKKEQSVITNLGKEMVEPAHPEESEDRNDSNEEKTLLETKRK